MTSLRRPNRLPDLRALVAKSQIAFFGLGSAAVLVSIVGLFRTKVLTTTLSLPDYGELSYGLSLFLMLQLLATLGVGTGLRRTLGVGGVDSARTIGTALTLTAAASLLAATAGVAVAAALDLSLLGATSGRQILVILAAAVPLAALDALWLDILYAEHRRKAVVAYLLGFRTFAAVSAAGGAVLGGVAGAAAGVAVGFLPSALWGFTRWGPAFAPTFDRRLARELLRLGGANQTIIVSNQCAAVAVRSIVIAQLSPALLAIYAVGVAVTVPLTQFIAGGLSGTFFNEFARADPGERITVLQTHRRLVENTSLILLPLAIILLPTLLRIVTTSEYQAAVLPGRILLVVAVIEALFFIDGNALFIGDKIRHYLFVQNAANVVLVVAAALAVRHGLAWVAAASVLAQLVQLVYSRSVVDRMLGEPSRPAIGRLLAFGLAGAAVVAPPAGATLLAGVALCLAFACVVHSWRQHPDAQVQSGA